MKIVKVFDANVYVNNVSQHGLASEVTLPDIVAVMSDYKAMGMIGSAEFFNGFDKMEASVKWTYPENDTMKAFANPMKMINLMVRSSKAEYDGDGITEEVPVVAYLRGMSKKHPGGSFKPKEDTEMENTLSVLYFRMEVDGNEIVEIDVLNNIYKVDGEDLLSTRRTNLGI